MSLAFVQYYVSANVLLLAACLLAMSVRFVSNGLRRPLSHRQQLHFAYWLVAISLAAPVIATVVEPHAFASARAEVWSAPSSDAPFIQSSGTSTATVSLSTTGSQLRLDLLARMVAALCAGGVLMAVARLVRAFVAVHRIVADSHSVRRRGSLHILATTDLSIPFSFWVPGKSFVVVPVSLIARPRDLRFAIRHETQHHRHGDTRLLWLKEILKGVFIINPGLCSLFKAMEELQEFVCDAAVVNRCGGNSRAYCECLLWVAHNALSQRTPGSCVAMATPKGRSVLARRIDALLEGQSRPPHFAYTAIQVGAAAVLLGTGILLAGSIHDRRITMAQAEEMAGIARRQTTVRIVVNPQVLGELNRLVGTPDGREYLRQTLARMQTYREKISQKLARRGLPEELLAVPMVESGYRNRSPDGDPSHGAGIWMFIQPTARAFSLRVDSARDDRLNPDSETDAAVEVFSSLNAHFGDWELALLAYNSGADFVDRSIREAGTRDPFMLAQLGYENEPDYLARVIATMIVMKNPRLLDAESS